MEVPSAAIVFSGFALFLFAWPGSGSSTRPSEPAPPTLLSDAGPRVGIRQIAITRDAPLQAATPLAAPPPMPVSQAAGDSIASTEPGSEQAAARRSAAISARRPSTSRKGTEARQASTRAAGQTVRKSETRPVQTQADAGILDRTLTLGSKAMNIAAVGADYARSTASRLGRSVASLIDDHI